jgi:ATP-dependent protease ClpP protease subunit
MKRVREHIKQSSKKNIVKIRKLNNSKRYKLTEIPDTDNDSDHDDNNPSKPDDFLFGLNVNVTEKNNHIYFRSSVSNQSVDKLVDLIHEKNEEFRELKRSEPLVQHMEPKPLYLFITSFGGSLFACFRAIDAIKRSEIPIYTVVDGHAASAATLMSVVGKKRFMTPNSYMLIHQLSSGLGGKYWEIKDEYKNLTLLMENIYKIYTDHTPMTKEELEEVLSHDSWWGIDTCKEKGLIDGPFI